MLKIKLKKENLVIDLSLAPFLLFILCQQPAFCSSLGIIVSSLGYLFILYSHSYFTKDPSPLLVKRCLVSQNDPFQILPP